MPTDPIQALKRQFLAAARDRCVDSAETEALIALVKEGGVSGSERRQLREHLIAHQDLFEPSARARLDRFIQEEIPGLLVDDPVTVDAAGRTDLPDPEVMEEDREALVYEWTAGNAFVDGPSAHDVVQGMIGDCYMMAAFAAVAAQEPSAIERAIRDNGDGTYTVRFLEPSWDGICPETYVKVDGQLPTRRGALYYGKARDRNELWVAILEKAYAAYRGGFAAVGHCGGAGKVMGALTGRKAFYTPLFSAADADAVFGELQRALAKGQCAAAATHGSSQTAMYAGTGLYAEHVYSILGVTEEGGKKYVVLRNPWGEVEPGSDGRDDGVFRLELPRFLRFFSGMEIC